MEYYVVFHSIHHLLYAEKLCREADIPLAMVPIPQKITSDCGMALKIEAVRLDVVLAVLSRAEVKYAGIYRLEGDRVERVE